MKLRRRIAALLSASIIALGMLGATVAPVSASFTCSGDGYDWAGSGTTYVKIYELTNYNPPGDPANSGILCVRAPSSGSTSIPDLKTVAYTNVWDTFSPKHCDGQLITSYGTWNDCASSVKVSMDCHHQVTAWPDANYGGTPIFAFSVSGQFSMSIGGDNRVSSLKITYNSICQTAPAP